MADSLQTAPLSASSTGMDADIFIVLSNTLEELGLECSPPEEPSCSRLDEWFLPERRQAPLQGALPLFPEVHDVITRSWHAPYSSCIRASSSPALTSVDGAEEKGYDSLPPMDEWDSYETDVQDDYIEADPHENMPRGLVLFDGYEIHLHSLPDSSPPQAILEMFLVAYQHKGPPLVLFLAPRTFTKCMDAALSPLTDGNPHPELPRWLAHFGPVR